MKRMANYNNNAGSAATPPAAVNPDAASFPATKGFSPPVPTQSLLADMCRNAGSQPSTRLSVVNSKTPTDAARPVYSAALSMASQSPIALAAELDRTGHQRLSVVQKPKVAAPTAPPPATPPATPVVPTAVPTRPQSAMPAAQKPIDSGISLTPCTATKDSAAIFPQVEALSTVLAGQPLNFGEALFSENTVIEHQPNTEVFCIRDPGVYELCYSLNYEVAAPCLLLVGFEGFSQSYFKQQITQAPTRGKLRATVRLLLDTGTTLRLVLVNDPAVPTIESALISNATLEIKQLYRLNISGADYSTGNPAKNFKSDHSFLPSVRTQP